MIPIFKHEIVGIGNDIHGAVTAHKGFIEQMPQEWAEAVASGLRGMIENCTNPTTLKISLALAFEKEFGFSNMPHTENEIGDSNNEKGASDNDG